MKFSRNPVNGLLEAYTDEGVYKGHVFTMGDLVTSKKETAQDGGPGSGNFGHSGRPGKVGGSGPGGGGGKESSGSGYEKSDEFISLIKTAKESRNHNDFLDKIPNDKFRNLYRNMIREGEHQPEFVQRIYEELKSKDLPKGVELKEDWTEKLSGPDKDFVKYKIERYGSETELVNHGYETATKLEFLNIMATTNDWKEKVSSRKFENLNDEEKDNLNFILNKFPSEGDALFQGCSNDVQNYFAALKAKEMGVPRIEVPKVPYGLEVAKSSRPISEIISEQNGGRVHTEAGDANRKAIKDSMSSGKMLYMDYTGIPKERAEAIKKAIIDSVDGLDDRVAELVAKKMDDAKVDWFGAGGTSCFNPAFGNIAIYAKNPYGKDESPERLVHVFWHEFGHYMDDGGKSYNDVFPKDPLKSTVGCSGPSQLVNGKDYNEAARKDVQALFDEAGLSDKYEVRAGGSGEYPVQIWRKSDNKFIYLTNLDPNEDDMPVITNAINNLLFKKAKKPEEIEKFMENHGMPPEVDASRYFKQEYDPVIGQYLIKNEEKYPGAREEYRKEEEKRDEAFGKWIESIGGHNGYLKLQQEKDKLEEAEEEKRKKYGAVTDCLDESVKGLFGMLVRWGGHDAQYYRGEIHPNETAANIFSIMARNDPELNAFANSVIPNITELFVKAWRVEGGKREKVSG